MLAGVYAPQLSSFGTVVTLIPWALFLSVAACLILRPLIVLLFLGGLAWFVVEARCVIDSRISSEFVGDSIVTDVKVASFVRTRDGTASFEALVHDSPWVPRRIRVNWRDPAETLRLGELWRLELRLRRPRGASNPGGFDYEGWLFRKRIAATGFVVASNRNYRLEAARPGWIDQVRQAAVDRLAGVFPDRDRAAVLAAVSVGARHLVTVERWERYAMTGTSHLMAISGLHVGMVAAVTYVLAAIVVVLIGGSKHQHRVATILAFSAAACYAVVSGFAVPAQRASMMIGLVALAVGYARPVRPFTVLALTSAALAIADPLVTLSPGFILSFLAVLVLLWMARSCRPTDNRLHAAGHLFRIQLALLLGLMPATILLFDRVAFVAPVINLVAVPIFSIVTVPLTLLGLLLDGPARPLGDLALNIAGRGLAVVEGLIDLGLQAPVPGESIPGRTGWHSIILVLPVLWAVLPAGWPGRSAAWVATVALAVAEPMRPAPGCAEVTVLDVGQGLAVMVLTRSQSLLYDTGPAYFSGGSAAASVILPFLRWRGVTTLDYLVVSHADADHAGGLGVITQGLEVRRIQAGESLVPGGQPDTCAYGQVFTHDGVRFEFLHPRRNAAVEGNDASCVLEISAGNYRLLLTGDIEKATEAELAASKRLRPAEVVVVPHHGSRTSSTAGFVDVLQPRLAVVSAGYRNRWGQPDARVVERWQARGAIVLNTATSGAVSFSLCENEGVTDITSNRDERRRLWHE